MSVLVIFLLAYPYLLISNSPSPGDCSHNLLASKTYQSIFQFGHQIVILVEVFDFDAGTELAFVNDLEERSNVNNVNHHCLSKLSFGKHSHSISFFTHGFQIQMKSELKDVAQNVSQTRVEGLCQSVCLVVIRVQLFPAFRWQRVKASEIQIGNIAAVIVYEIGWTGAAQQLFVVFE